MIKPEHGHKPIKTESAGSKSKLTSKPNVSKELADLKKVLKQIERTCEIQLSMWRSSSSDYHRGANTQAKHILLILGLLNKPTIRDEKDDLL